MYYILTLSIIGGITLLKADKNIQKLLISSPCKFERGYGSANFRIDKMLNFDTNLQPELVENPYSKNYFVITIETEPPNGIAIPNYTGWSNIYCSLFSIFFGKRFDNCGPIQNAGFYCLPNLSQKPLSHYYMAFNNGEPRADLNIPLNFNQLSKMFDFLLDEDLDKPHVNTLIQASKFYLRALQSIEISADMAYLDLITCGEILSNSREYSEAELYGHDLQLTKFIAKLTDGKDIDFVKSRLFQVKRKFFLSTKGLLNDTFFAVSEVKDSARNGIYNFTRDNIDTAIKAAYDLRSDFVHTGGKYSNSLMPMPQVYNEIINNNPCGCDPELGKLFEKAASFTGLERIMRYCLLRFIHTQITPIDSSLD